MCGRDVIVVLRILELVDQWWVGRSVYCVVAPGGCVDRVMQHNRTVVVVCGMLVQGVGPHTVCRDIGLACARIYDTCSIGCLGMRHGYDLSCDIHDTQWQHDSSHHCWEGNDSS